MYQSPVQKTLLKRVSGLDYLDGIQEMTFWTFWTDLLDGIENLTVFLNGLHAQCLFLEVVEKSAADAEVVAGGLFPLFRCHSVAKGVDNVVHGGFFGPAHFG